MTRPIILCVRNDPADSFGDAPRLLGEAGCEIVVLDAFDPNARWPAVRPSRASATRADGSPSAVGGVIVFGGEMNADQLDRYPYLLAVRRLMREAVESEVPTLGICLGAQLLARAFDAPVTRAPVRELGFVPIWPTEAAAADPLLESLRAGDRFFEWHEDTFALPREATLLATGQAVRHQAFRIRRRGWGIQFHAEVDATEIEAWLTQAAGTVATVWGRTGPEVRAEAAAYLPAQERQARAVFRTFAREVTRRGPATA